MSTRVNASFQVGLTYMNSHARRALGACTPPEVWEHHLESGGLGLEHLTVHDGLDNEG